jgi:hypothetical protein
MWSAAHLAGDGDRVKCGSTISELLSISPAYRRHVH